MRPQYALKHLESAMQYLKRLEEELWAKTPINKWALRTLRDAIHNVEHVERGIRAEVAAENPENRECAL